MSEMRIRVFLTAALTADIEATFRSRYARREEERRAALDRQLQEAKTLAAADAKKKAAADVEAEMIRLRTELSRRVLQ